MEIIFTGDYLSYDFRLKCNKNLQFLLRRERVLFGQNEFSVEMQAANCMIVSFCIVASNPAVSKELNELLDKNMDFITS